MSGEKRKGDIKFLKVFIFIILIFLDRVSKFFLVKNLSYEKSYPVFKNFLYITLVKNKGGVFGILYGFNTLFIILTVLILFITILFYKKLQNNFIKWGILFQIAGATSNLIDRIRFGYVIDYIDFRFWPVFNLADVFITVGCILLITGVIMYSPDDSKKNAFIF